MPYMSATKKDNENDRRYNEMKCRDALLGVVMVLLNQPLHVFEHRSILLTQRVWGQSPFALAQRHCSSCGVEADANILPSLYAIIQL